MTEELPPDLAPWFNWLRNYIEAADVFLQEEATPVETEEERELLAIKLSLYARSLSLLQGCLLLIENDRQLDFRSHARGIIEAAIYLIAIDRDATLIGKMADDDRKSRHARASLHLRDTKQTASDEVLAELEVFVAQGAKGLKYVELSELVTGGDFERLYRTFRDISADASHVSVTSLQRHYLPDPETQTATIIVNPLIGDYELLQTLVDLAVSMLIETMLIMKTKVKTDSWEAFAQLNRRYREMLAERARILGRGTQTDHL